MAEPEEERPANIIMAASQGAQTGVKLAVAVGAMVLAFVALVALANGILGGIGGWFGYPELSFQRDRRLCLRAGVLAARRARLGRGAARRRVCSAPSWCSTNSSPSSNWARSRRVLAADRRGGDVCAVRFRQLQVDRDPDGGDRQPRTQPAPGDRAAGDEGAGRGILEQPDERGVGGIVFVTMISVALNCMSQTRSC